MSSRRSLLIGSSLSLAVFLSIFLSLPARAEVSSLKEEIANKQAEIASINNKLEAYKKKINEFSSKAASLEADVALLENDLAITELDVVSTETEIESAELQIKLLDEEILLATENLNKEKAILRELLFTLHTRDAAKDQMEALLSVKNLLDIFRVISDLESVNGDLKNTLQATSLTKASLEDKMQDQQSKISDLQALRNKLELALDALTSRKNAKELLIAETESSEAGYRVLMSELRQEQQAIAARINELENKVQEALSLNGEEPSAETLISWPLKGRITTLFHDPTYPFRRLFEHSGLDIAIPQGTPVLAAAPGVVAWARTGSQYGNYVMIIHANGKATLYAHLSRIDVAQDAYVSRGQVIGLSGGRPGTQGAGLSTGPHLHFELRQNGLPIDPMPFLP